MEKIMSRINPEQLLHFVYRKDDISTKREDLSPDNEFLQLSCFVLEKGKTFRPHKHIFHEKITTIAQESWVVLEGDVEVTYYDLDDSIYCQKKIRLRRCFINISRRS